MTEIHLECVKESVGGIEIYKSSAAVLQFADKVPAVGSFGRNRGVNGSAEIALYLTAALLHELDISAGAAENSFALALAENYVNINVTAYEGILIFLNAVSEHKENKYADYSKKEGENAGKEMERKSAKDETDNDSSSLEKALFSGALASYKFFYENISVVLHGANSLHKIHHLPHGISLLII